MLEFRRLESIDLMRGLVMVLMALDHTRDYFSDALFDPTDLDKTSPGLFLTRWITHLCAPTFVFLTGTSAFLSTVRRNLSNKQLAWYLISRGLWLVVMELTLVRFGWLFNWNYHVVFGQVIWVLGWSMVGLAGLSFLPRWVVAVVALVVIVGHNLLDYLQPVDFGSLGWLWTILHDPGRIELSSGYNFYVSYPLIPWLGVMAAGFGFGPLFLQAPSSRKLLLIRLGIVLIGLFLLLRLNHWYGDPNPWLPQHNPWFSIFAILNCEKYPPSLHYLSMTLGMMMLMLAALERYNLNPAIRQPLLLFGRVPLFFYLIHLPVIHGAALAITYLRGMPVDWLFGLGGQVFPTIPSSESGYSLPAVYGFWFVLLLLLYPFCTIFAKFKHQHPEMRMLSYI